MRLLTIISGIMLVLTGLFCFANSGETFLALAFILGLVMILSSVIQIISYWWGRDDRTDNNGWIFSEAVITLILGILVQTSLIAADVAIPMVFGMWIMFSGVLRFVVATMINPSRKTSNFVWTMVIGILSILCGIYAFVNPMTANLPIAVLLGIIFLIQGIGILELGIHMPHEKKDGSKPKAKMIKIQIRKPMTKAKKQKAALAAAQAVPAGEELEVDSEVVKTDEITLDDLRDDAPITADIDDTDVDDADFETVEPEEINLDDIINALSIGSSADRQDETETADSAEDVQQDVAVDAEKNK